MGNSVRKSLLISLLASVFIGNFAIAEQKNNCKIGAYTNSHSYKKIIVRNAPTKNAKIIDILIPYYQFDEIKGTDLIIQDIKNDYAKVFYRDYAKRTLSKIGWIETKTLAFNVQSEVAYSYPNIKAFPVYHGESEQIYHGNIDKIHACKNEWLQITFKPDNQKPIKAWTRGICANQETTCEGLLGDSWNK